MKNTSVSLGTHFDEFLKNQIDSGRYKNASEVIRAALRLLEDEERYNAWLRAEIQKGIDSEIVENFDFEEHLKALKAKKRKSG
jgi:antitoxin ParD1/3/4